MDVDGDLAPEAVAGFGIDVDVKTDAGRSDVGVETMRRKASNSCAHGVVSRRRNVMIGVKATRTAPPEVVLPEHERSAILPLLAAALDP